MSFPARLDLIRYGGLFFLVTSTALAVYLSLQWLILTIVL